MGLLYKTRTYLVGSMQYSEGRSWRDEITPKLEKMGITVFDPYKKPFVSNVDEDEKTRAALAELMNKEDLETVAERMKPVRNYDLRLCDLSDFIIAHIIPHVASWGSAEELVTSCKMHKPTFVSIEGGRKKCPLWVTAMFPTKYIYNNVGEIVSVLERIDSGEKPMDSKRWKLLKEEFR